MRKAKKLWIKQEKRIVKLLYRKGLLPVKIEELYWAEYHSTKKRYRSKNFKHKFTEYFPEIFYGESDYWGEWSDYGAIDTALNHLYWSHVNIEPNSYDEGQYPKSTFKHTTRLSFIKYLHTLPTVNFDNKINKILRIDTSGF